MGIDIFARWKGQTEDERKKQAKVWLVPTAGDQGYLREAYHGEPYALTHLCAEAFKAEDGAPITAQTLRERLPHALELAEERGRNLNQTDEQTEMVKQSLRDFVDFCEGKEQETGEPVVIGAWW